MKDFDLKKECEKTDFDYSDFWKDKEEEKAERVFEELPKGEPRKGLKGRYIKVKGYVSKNRIKKSYSNFFKGNGIQ